MNGTFIIAEAGVNHNADLSLARGLIDAAAAAGADAVKFQTAIPELVVENDIHIPAGTYAADLVSPRPSSSGARLRRPRGPRRGASCLTRSSGPRMPRTPSPSP